MSLIQITTLAIMAVFYIAYFAKQINQRKQGINTMILGEGDKPKNQKRLEIMLKVATFTVPAVEIASIWWNLMELPLLVQWIGVAIAALGVSCFIAGMMTMKGSWRAGIPEKKETTLITEGIYRMSRNPAFLGFDLMYVGILVSFPNVWHALATALTIILFHKQILSEERFLEEAFGDEYLYYKKKTNRYI